jgi:hypothetical protein
MGTVLPADLNVRYPTRKPIAAPHSLGRLLTSLEKVRETRLFKHFKEPFGAPFA